MKTSAEYSKNWRERRAEWLRERNNHRRLAERGPPPYRCDMSCGDSKCRRKFDTWAGLKGHKSRTKNPPDATHNQRYVTPEGGARTRAFAFRRYMRELGPGKRFTAWNFNDWLINNYPMLTIGRSGSWLSWNAVGFGAVRDTPRNSRRRKDERTVWVTPR